MINRLQPDPEPAPRLGDVFRAAAADVAQPRLKLLLIVAGTSVDTLDDYAQAYVNKWGELPGDNSNIRRTYEEMRGAISDLIAKADSAPPDQS